ncbi:UxaA family hydrolase [uncultured Oscillibacter sp.]|uniref:UxaA family hydrolase n=1 Tax=uncultured Oscillibacter sp. TaxID=876091 RepID=UPI00262E8B04|nr:UxaA family hydrolase [uncultured Oscillibacter sp.]
MDHATTFMGYYRPDGQVGIRNYVIAVANCSCANGIINQIAARVPGIVPMIHTDGCSTPRENERWRETLVGVCCNPNVYAVVLVGVGCETDDAKEIGQRVAKESKKPVFAAVVQQDGGGAKVIEAAVKAGRQFVADSARCVRQEAPISKIILATECGGSDAFSGITANPAIGYVSDWIVNNGGTSILSEIPELFGTEEILARRSITPEVGQKVKDLIYEWQERTRCLLGENTGRTLARGNMDGGLTTIQEKALGCVHKGGTSTVMDVIGYSERIGDRKGLIIMDGPGYDTDNVTGCVASGAQLFMFSTGRGNPLGYPIAPVIKICSNSKTYYAVGGDEGDMDINAGAIITDGMKPEELGEKCIEYLLDVCNGKQTRPEILGYGGAMCVWSTSSPF